MTNFICLTGGKLSIQSQNGCIIQVILSRIKNPLYSGHKQREVETEKGVKTVPRRMARKELKSHNLAFNCNL